MLSDLTSKQFKHISAAIKAGRRKSDELHLHKAVVNYINNVIPGHDGFHIPNGERRSPATGAKLKAMGARAGVVDYCLPYDGGKTLWMEFKRDGERPRGAQKVFIESLQRKGHAVAIIYSLDDVRNTFKALGIQTREAK